MDKHHTVPANLPENHMLAVERVCQAFEQQWQAGTPPRLSDLLQSVDEELRAELLVELVAIDAEYRCRQGQRVALEDYQRQFPDHDKHLEAVWTSIAEHLSEDTQPIAIGGQSQLTDRDREQEAQRTDGGKAHKCQHRTDYHLLLGLLALQNGFVSRDELVAVVGIWLDDKSVTLGQIFLKRNVLTADEVRLLAALVDKHLEKHDNNVEKSLGALSSIGPLREELMSLGDSELERSLGRVTVFKERNACSPQNLQARASAEPRFRILRPHARGGLGQVSIAVDEELNREVALKEILPQHAAHIDSRTRFVLEAEITGRLEHPGIVPVYGFGQFADGRPFYAMRFIHGRSMTSAIEEFHAKGSANVDPGQHLLRFRELLRHFNAVCRAIHYAHVRGVLHRDLKPANVMLGRHGETLVVDWGLAKPVGETLRYDETQASHLVPLSGSKSAPTAMGSTLGTPAYMSPEQAAGEWKEVGTRSDVYSLGATLYHLLVGKPAFGGSISEILEKVQAGDFRRPRDINPGVPKPLEAICLKSMAMSPDDRYESTEALACDVEKWLADEPVSARKDSLVARGFRWLRHHRSWATAALLLLISVTLVSALAAILVNAEKRRAIAARADAVTRFRQARNAVDTWLTGANEYLLYYPNMGRVRTKLLEQAVTDYEALAASGGEDVDIEIERGRTLLRLGDVRKELSQNQDALEAYRKAARVLKPIISAYPDSLEGHLVYAKASTRLGVMERESGAHLEAGKTYESAVSTLNGAVSSYPNDHRIAVALADALVNQAVCFADSCSYERAETAFRAAISRLQRTDEEGDGGLAILESLATAHHLLGRLLTDLGRYSDATREVEKSLNIFDRLVDHDPMSLSMRADAKNSLTYLLRLQGRSMEEERLHQSIVEDYRTLVSAFPQSPVLTEKMAIAKLNLGQLAAQLERPAEACQLLKESLLLLQESVWDPAAVPSSQHCLIRAVCCDSFGEILSDRGEHVQAEQCFTEAVDLLSLLVKRAEQDRGYRSRLAIVQSHMAQFLRTVGRDEEAADLFDSSCNSLQDLIKASPQIPSIRNQLAIVLSHRGRMYFEADDSFNALKVFSHAVEVWEDLLDRQPTPAAQHLRDYAWFLVTCSDPQVRDSQRSVDLMRRAMANAEKNPTYYSTLGIALARAGNCGGAQGAFETAMQCRGGRVAYDWFFLSMALWELGKKDEARECLALGKAWMAEQRPENAELIQFRGEVASLLGVE